MGQPCPQNVNKNMRQFASLGLRMIARFMSDLKEKHGHYYDLPLFYNMSKQFLAPGGLSGECVLKVIVTVM